MDESDQGEQDGRRTTMLEWKQGAPLGGRIAMMIDRIACRGPQFLHRFQREQILLGPRTGSISWPENMPAALPAGTGGSIRGQLPEFHRFHSCSLQKRGTKNLAAGENALGDKRCERDALVRREKLPRMFHPQLPPIRLGAMLSAC